MAKLEPRSPRLSRTNDLDQAVSKVLKSLGEPEDQPARRQASPAEVFAMFAEELEKELQKQASLLNLSTEDEEFLRDVGIDRGDLDG